MKLLVGAFNQEKALVGAFSVIVKTDRKTDGSFYSTLYPVYQDGLRSLLRGLSYPLYSVGAINSLFFGVYTRALELTADRHRRAARTYRGQS